MLFSGQAGGRASHATSAPARACSIVRAGTRRILSSVFFELAPTMEREETNRVFHFVTTYRTPHLSDLRACLVTFWRAYSIWPGTTAVCSRPIISRVVSLPRGTFGVTAGFVP